MADGFIAVSALFIHSLTILAIQPVPPLQVEPAYSSA
jgi:hypothetical protein